MSYTEIYKFNKEGQAEMIGEVKNAFRGAMAVWTILEKKYLPKYVPSWAFDLDKEYSRMGTFDRGGAAQIWNLVDDSRLSEAEKIVLSSTFDNVVVMVADIPKLVAAFRAFEGDTSLAEQADLIEGATDLIAIAWNQTSVNGDAWQSDTSVIEDDDEFYPPYNILKENKHWDLFKPPVND